MASFGATMIRVDGNYDDFVAEAARVAAEKGWLVVSDTAWPGYERIPGLVMQGYTAMVRETLRKLPEPPTHVFLQAGVGGFAAAVAGHLSILDGKRRPAHHRRRAGACRLRLRQRQGRTPREDPAWRADGDGDARMLRAVAGRLAHPVTHCRCLHDGRRGGRGRGDAPPRPSGWRRSGRRGWRKRRRRIGGADPGGRRSRGRIALGLDKASRVLVVNTEGATDPEKYLELVGLTPDAVGAGGKVAA